MFDWPHVEFCVSWALHLNRQAAKDPLSRLDDYYTLPHTHTHYVDLSTRWLFLKFVNEFDRNLKTEVDEISFFFFATDEGHMHAQLPLCIRILYTTYTYLPTRLPTTQGSQSEYEIFLNIKIISIFFFCLLRNVT